jgi:ribosomal protein S18 acetylase RimI-like enzyme
MSVEIMPLPRLEGAERDLLRLWVYRSRQDEGLRLKLNLDPVPHYGGAWGAFVARENGASLGYSAIFPGEPAEFSGFVHPARRRQGIGTALLDAVRQELRLRAVTGQLVCEDRSISGQAFIAPLYLPVDYTEHLLQLDALIAQPPRFPDLIMRRATLDDLDAVAGVMASAFRDPFDYVRRFVANELPRSGQETFVAAIGNEIVGTVKAIDLGEGAVGIYAFAVAPEQQGRGLGRDILAWLVRKLQADGWRTITLEVDATNLNAYHLYHSSGFVDVTTYGYYRVEI